MKRNSTGLGGLASRGAAAVGRMLSGRGTGTTARTPGGGGAAVVTFGNRNKRAEWVQEEEAARQVSDWAKSLGTDPESLTEAEKSLAQYGPLGMMIAKAMRGGRGLSGVALQAAAKLIKAFRGGGSSRPARIPGHAGENAQPVGMPLQPGDPGFAKAVEEAERASRTIMPPGPNPVKRVPNASEADRAEAMAQHAQPEFSPLYRTPESSNVWSFQYRYTTSTLFVRFKAPALNADAVVTSTPPGRLTSHRGALGKTVTGKTNEPGPLYAYFDVPVRVFSRLVKAHSAGKAVWDNLRIRGTVWGHQFRYSLAEGANVAGQDGREGLYVPRRATQQGFKTRSVTAGGTGRRAYAMSTLPSQIRPHRGQPDRGRTWQSRRYRPGG